MQDEHIGTESFGQESTGRRVRDTGTAVSARPEPAVPAARATGPRAAFARFRRTRPFWGCLLLALGGWLVLKPLTGASFQMIVGMGMTGTGVILIGGGMMLAAVCALFIPSNRHFLGIVGLALSVISLPFANLGGWIIGMLLGIIGAGLVFAWAPYSDAQLAERAGRDRRRSERRAERAAR